MSDTQLDFVLSQAQGFAACSPTTFVLPLEQPGMVRKAPGRRRACSDWWSSWTLVTFWVWTILVGNERFGLVSANPLRIFICRKGHQKWMQTADKCSTCGMWCCYSHDVACEKCLLGIVGLVCLVCSCLVGFVGFRVLGGFRGVSCA